MTLEQNQSQNLVTSNSDDFSLSGDNNNLLNNDHPDILKNRKSDIHNENSQKSSYYRKSVSPVRIDESSEFANINKEATISIDGMVPSNIKIFPKENGK